MENMKNITQALQTYVSSSHMQEQLDIARLWQHWPEIVGSGLSEMAKPLGRRKAHLIIGVTDSVAMQELRFYADDILDRVGQFLEHQPFDKVSVELIKGRTCLDGVQIEQSWITPKPKIPENVGQLGPYLPEGSAIRSCYEAYIRALEDCASRSSSWKQSR
jgi:hypothetical protein